MLKIFSDYYDGKEKPRTISLYTTLTSLQKMKEEMGTNYIIRAEAAITALHTAGGDLGKILLIAMILGDSLKVLNHLQYT